MTEKERALDKSYDKWGAAIEAAHATCEAACAEAWREHLAECAAIEAEYAKEKKKC